MPRQVLPARRMRWPRSRARLAVSDSSRRSTERNSGLRDNMNSRSQKSLEHSLGSKDGFGRRVSRPLASGGGGFGRLAWNSGEGSEVCAAVGLPDPDAGMLGKV